MRAALFDLDRTLLPVVSGPVISAALREVGLLGPAIPGQQLAFRFFDTFGENRLAMMAAKRGARMTRGWERETVREAGRLAAPQLETLVHPWTRQLLEEHRAAGDRLVLATTTPFDVLEAFAEALGFDHLVATRYRTLDGHYDGSIQGHFVWGRGKLQAVRDLARAEDLDLSISAAYSDSWFDAPMLNEVGHPVAVNPDPRLAVLATVRGWTIRHLDGPDGAPRVLGVDPLGALAEPIKLAVRGWASAEFSGLDHIPKTGPAIVAANHRSYFDPLLIAATLAERGRVGRFMAKAELFETPVVKDLIAATGAIPVSRGSGSSAPLDAAADALAAGEVVVILPEGTIPRGEDFFAPTLTGRPGAARLAAATGAPIIPLGLWGTEKVWPRADSFPKPVLPWQRPSISASAGPPVALKGRSEKADTKRVMKAIMGLLPPAARQPYVPTEEELAATHPS